MNSLFPKIFLTTSMTLVAGVGSMSAGRPQTVEPSAVAAYVYPANTPAAPSSMTFMPDGQTYLMLSSDGKQIKSYETATGKETGVILDLENTRETKLSSIEGFSLSDDGTILIVWRFSEKIYRRSMSAEYYTYNIYRNILRPLSTEHPRQMSPVVSPDSRMVAFVADNNIYIKKLDYNSEVSVTTDGEKNSVINGVPDWTYEEEFATTVSMAWSPENDFLCFLKYNETDVPMYDFMLYQGSCNPMDTYELYPGEYSYKYPVAGQRNSRVTLHSYEVDTRKTKQIEFKDATIEYIPRIAYATATQLVVTTLNRPQNRMEVYTVNPRSTVVKSLIVEESRSWIDPIAYEGMDVSKAGIVLNSARSGYNHLYAYSLTGQLLGQLTSGDYDVTAYYGRDNLGNIYYQSTAQGPVNRIVTRKDRKGVETVIGDAAGTTSISFAPSMSYFTMAYSSIDTPPTYTLYNNKLKSIRTLEDNSSIAGRYAGTPRREFMAFESDGYKLNAYMVKPADFNPSKKYPVIMWLYNGPGSQEVLNRWSIGWEQAAADQGFIVVCADGRGTGGRGNAFQSVVYKNLGHYETIDQINVARSVAQLPYVDASRIGVCGWSYGGYETLMCAQAQGSPFAAAVAIAPVTSWRYYDTVYTERYMDTPQANFDGYIESAPTAHVSRMNTRLLLMTGTADDNVHMSNTIEYVARLQSAGKLCDMLLFPNMNHSINGCSSRSLVYAKMIEYFKNNI
ncbi:MAG: S9 family peptidase [Muribaculaceae bacterium]|nr:S9 family peptidase [Muribaculaceae bacterium]